MKIRHILNKQVKRRIKEMVRVIKNRKSPHPQIEDIWDSICKLDRQSLRFLNTIK